MEQLEGFWRPLLDTPSKPNSRTPEPVREPAWETQQPMAVRDIDWAIQNSNNKTAPGPDGRTLQHAKSIPKLELLVLFNLWLMSSCLPSDLCVGITTLIPKESGTNEPAKFRPITVSSILVRLYNKIIARCLESACPVSPRQKAFRIGDGIAENVHIL